MLLNTILEEREMRFSLRMLLIAMAVLSAWFAMLTLPDGVARVCQVSLFGVLRVWFLCALVLMVIERDRSRAYWFGVFVLGVGWMWGERIVFGSTQNAVSSTSPVTMFLMQFRPESRRLSASYLGFMTFAESLFVFCLSLAGGRFAAWAYDRRETPANS